MACSKQEHRSDYLIYSHWFEIYQDSYVSFSGPNWPNEFIIFIHDWFSFRFQHNLTQLWWFASSKLFKFVSGTLMNLLLHICMVSHLASYWEPLWLITSNILTMNIQHNHHWFFYQKSTIRFHHLVYRDKDRILLSSQDSLPEHRHIF